MAMAYPPELRERVLAGYDEGLPTRQIASNLRVSKAWCKRVRQLRDRPPVKVGGSKPKLDSSGRCELERFVGEKPDATLAELQTRVARELGIRISTGALWNTLKRLKLTLKKNR
jgi:transposase